MNELSELVLLAEDGDCVAQNALGAKLAQAGGDQNERAALYWYLAAVEQGYVDSMWNVATMLLAGEGGIQNQELALRLIRIAAESGHNSACLYLADCYESEADGFKQDSDLAGMWRAAAWDFDNEQDYAESVELDQYLAERPPKPQ